MILNYKKKQKTKTLFKYKSHKWVRNVKLLQERDVKNSRNGFIYTYEIDFLYIDSDGEQHNKLNQKILERHYRDFTLKQKYIEQNPNK